jgi:transcriptional regulator with XRE-family HTH domain
MSSSETAPRGELGDSPSWTLADRINYLFDNVRRADGKPHSNDEVAAVMGARGGSTVSGAYLSLLRRGERDNPTKKHLEAIAEFFDVSPAFFFDDAGARAIVDEINLLRTLADAGVKRVATRLGGLSADSLRDIESIVERVRALEGLDNID